VAICFLHSWRDDAHERAAAEAVRTALPDVFVTTSGKCSRRSRSSSDFHGLRQCLCRADRVAVPRTATRAGWLMRDTKAPSS